MNYLLLALGMLATFAWGMLTAIWFIDVRTDARLARLIGRMLDRPVTEEEARAIVKTVLSQTCKEAPEVPHESETRLQ
jgi:hypothetical protein